MADLGPNELARRWRDARNLIRENGVVYNLHADPGGETRPWQLDPIPLLLDPAEFASLEAGLAQRARLLELILADLYGPQQLVRDGHLPAGLVYPNPGFLRPCHGFHPAGGRYLYLTAVNLGRGEDGRWRVIGDRPQSPSGAGYALENRIVLTHTLPEAFRNSRVRRLALFFRSLRDSLRAAAPNHRDNPRTVLLTPGPYSETYFEHSFLARYLGYTLAEGGDLTVRDNRVFLKVLGGLQPVDVVFRRLDDGFCDPLELRSDSSLGVPGLTHAARCGTVAVANALGTGAAETPALAAFLPRLCRVMLGEDLRLESVPTWWCGDPTDRRYVLDHLRELVVKPAFVAPRGEPVFPDELSVADRAELVDRIRARPHEFVAQARLDLSTAPVLADGKLVPRRVVLRAFVAADGDGFAVMPGGLARVSGSADGRVVSLRHGGGCKDTWVPGGSPQNEFSLLAADGRVELSRAGGDLPSRAADNLYWLGRYAERADGTARLLRGIAGRLADRPGLADAPELHALWRALGHTDPPTEPTVTLRTATFDRHHPGSLATAVRAVWQGVGAVRDLVSLDMGRVLGGLAEFPANSQPHHTPADLLGLLNRTIFTLSAFAGLAADSMTRTIGWRFLDTGRRLERALHISALLRGSLDRSTQPEGTVLDAVLEVADSGMTYRRRYLASLRADAVIDLLVCDETNPRSLAAVLTALTANVDHLPRKPLGAERGAEQRLALAALNAVRLAQPDDLARVTNGTRPALRELLDQLDGWLPELSDALTQQYLAHLHQPRQLAGDPGPGAAP